MSDTMIILSWTVGAVIAGEVTGALLNTGARLAVDIMERLQAGAQDLAEMRRRTAIGNQLLIGLRRRAQGRTKALNAVEATAKKRASVYDAKRREERTLKEQPFVNIRMVGDERGGDKCFAAHVVNRLTVKNREVHTGSWLVKEWRESVLAVLWADSRGDARAKIESVYPLGEGFVVGSIFEFDGNARPQT